MQGQQYMYCADISAGVEAFPVPAVIDDPAGLRDSGVGPPVMFPPGFTYCTQPGALPMTPAARRFLEAVYPVTKPADIWAGCQHTHAAGARTPPTHNYIPHTMTTLPGPPGNSTPHTPQLTFASCLSLQLLVIFHRSPACANCSASANILPHVPSGYHRSCVIDRLHFQLRYVACRPPGHLLKPL